MPYLRPAAEARKDRSVQGRAYIEFPVNKTTLYPEYRNNPTELAKIVETIRVVKEDKNTKISGIVIHGFASPESPYDHNAWLAEHRAATLKDHVRKMLDIDNSLFRVGYTAEDWKGLREYVAASSLPHRDEILQVVDDSRLDPDTREWRIKLRWPDDYRIMLDECYPTLRHSDYVVNYTVKAFSVDETREVMKTNPKLLSLEEMFLLAQTYEPGSGACSLPTRPPTSTPHSPGWLRATSTRQPTASTRPATRQGPSTHVGTWHCSRATATWLSGCSAKRSQQATPTRNAT